MKGIQLQVKNELKKYFLPHLMSDGTIIIDYYVRIIMFLYPLFIVKEKIFTYISGQIFLLAVLTVTTSIVYIFLIIKKRAEYTIQFCKPEIWFLALAFLLLCKIGTDIVVKRRVNEYEVFYFCLAILPLLIKEVGKGYKYYLNLFFFSSFFFCASLLYYSFVGRNIIPIVEEGIVRSEAINSYLLLTACMSSVFYCIIEDKKLIKFYLIMSGVSYTLLFLLSDIISILLVVFFLLLIPIFLPATVSLIKRNLSLCYIFLAVLSNIPVLQFIMGIKENIKYKIEYSIYVYILMSITTLFINRYWKKIPKDKNPHFIIMKKMKRVYRYIFLFFSFVMANCILFYFNSFLNEISENELLKSFILAFTESISSYKSVFYVIVEQYGIVGGTAILCLMIISCDFLLKNLQTDDVVIRVMILLGVLFWAQCFFFHFQAMSAPVYMVLLTFGMNNRRRRMKDK